MLFALEPIHNHYASIMASWYWKWKWLNRVWLFATPWTVQSRTLEWVAFPFSRGSSQPRDWTRVSCITGGFFTSWATGEAQEYWSGQPNPCSVNLPNQGIKLGSPALQADSLPTELSGKPKLALFLPKRPLDYFSKYFFLIFIFSKLWKHNNIFVGDLENAEQNYR